MIYNWKTRQRFRFNTSLTIRLSTRFCLSVIIILHLIPPSPAACCPCQEISLITNSLLSTCNGQSIGLCAAQVVVSVVVHIGSDQQRNLLPFSQWKKCTFLVLVPCYIAIKCATPPNHRFSQEELSWNLCNYSIARGRRSSGNSSNHAGLIPHHSQPPPPASPVEVLGDTGKRRWKN